MANIRHGGDAPADSVTEEYYGTDRPSIERKLGEKPPHASGSLVILRAPSVGRPDPVALREQQNATREPDLCLCVMDG